MIDATVTLPHLVAWAIGFGLLLVGGAVGALMATLVTRRRLEENSPRFHEETDNIGQLSDAGYHEESYSGG